MAMYSDGKRLLPFLVGFVALINGVLAQDTTTPSSGLTTTYIYIIAIGGGVVIFGIGGFLLRSICYNRESSLYKCGGLCGDDNAVEEMPHLMPGQHTELSREDRKKFESMGHSTLAKTSMATADYADRSDWHTPPEKENLIVEDLHIEMMDAAKADQRPREHILLSYEPSVTADVKRFRERLRRERFRVWFDVEQEEKYDLDERAEAMARAIKEAAVVVPVLTGMYERNAKCKKEIEYADRIKKTLVPVRMQKKYRPDGWLAFLLGNTLFHDLANENTYQAQIDNFLEAIESVGINAKIAEDDFDDD